jgi:hypothetical protein
MADGLDATAAIIRVEQEEAHDDTMSRLEGAYHAGLISGDQAMALYQQVMAPWFRLADSLVVARQVLIGGQHALDSWIRSGELPQSWGVFCEDIEDALQAVVTLLESCDVEVPAGFQVAIDYAEEICMLAAPYIEED